MSTDCVITCNHPDDIYNSGDTLNGQEYQLQWLVMKKFVGNGKTLTSYTSHEEYLNSVTYVIGSEDGDYFDLEAGIYDYTFTCELPKELPTSMKDKIGKIKYKVIVTIDRPLRFDNVFKKEFIVHQMLDLNLNLHDKLPVKCTGAMEIAPFFCCCCLSGTEIKAELQLPCGAYVPGQTIPFHLIVYNDSNINLSGAEVYLMKCYTYRSTEPSEKQKKVEEVIKIRTLNDIPRNTNKEFKSTFKVPDLPPTDLTRFMNINYKLKAKINVFGYSIKQFYVEIPITIGTIPFDDFEPSF